MSKIKNNNSFNNGAYPQHHYYGDSYSGCTLGLSKLEYTAIKIFCAMLISSKNFGSDKQMLKSSVEEAKLLLQECEEEARK
jgi:hypothetical protein